MSRRQRACRCGSTFAHDRRRLHDAPALRASSLRGRCMRCLEPASPLVEVDAREVDLPGAGEQEASPYVEHELLALREWAHDAFALAAPVQILCEPACAGLCPVCAIRLATAEPGHHHEAGADPRWAALREIKLE